MEHPTGRSEKKGVIALLFSRPETLPVFLFILFFVIFYAAVPELRSSKYVFDPPRLFLAFNTAFTTGLCLLIAGLCFRSFLRGGFLNVLLLGCGVLTFGLSSFAAGWLIRPSHDPNDIVTIHNVGVFCMAGFYFLCSLFTAFGFSIEITRRRGLIAAAAYGAVLASGTVLTAETVGHFLPAFFVIGEGPTAIRQVVLSVSVTLLITSALLMMTVFAERKSRFLLYTINALLLLSAGIVGVALGVPGSPLSWLGRGTQHLGNIYLALASMQALTEARSRGTTVERAMSDFFRKSETHFRALVEMAADAIVSIDREGKIIQMNPAAEETFGYAREEASGQSLAGLIVPEQSRELFHECLYGDSCRNIGMDLMGKDGTVLPAELSFSPEMRTGGGVARTLIIRDVTERRQAEEALRSAALFPIQNPSPILRIHRDGTLLFSNPAAETVLKEWRTESKDGIPARIRQAIESVFNEGAPQELEIRIAGRDFSFVVTPIGEVQYANLYGLDVTERKRAEAALQESEDRYRGLFESMNEGFALHELLYDESGEPCDYRFLDVNPAFERLTGLKRQDVVGRTVTEVLPGAEPYWIKQYGNVALTGRAAHFESHSSVLDRDYAVYAYRTEPGRFAVIFLDITDRMKAEEALREAKEHLEKRVEERTAELQAVALYARSLLEANLDALVTVSAEGRITDVNRATEQATGVPRDRLVGSDFSEYFTDPDAARAGYRKVFTEGQVRDYPLTMQHASGRLTDVLYHASVYRNEAGDILGVFAAARDVTELRKVEAALREANESLEQRVSERTEALQHAKDYAETLIRTANVLIVGLDEAGNVQTFNDAAEEITGYTRAEMLGRNWFEVAVPKDRYPHVWNEFLRIQEQSFPSEFENPIVTKDGRERIISWRNSEIRKDGRARGTISFGRDVTDSKRAEEALRASELRMKAVADHLPVGVWFADETGKIVYGNEAGQRIWAGAHYVDPEEFHVYRAWWADTGEPLGPEDWAVVRAVRKGETSLREVLDIECFDGTKKTILNSAVPLTTADGSLMGVVVLNEDITERIEAEQSLRRSEARYRSYIEVAGQMGWTTNADGEVVDDAPGFRQYTGQTFDEIRGRGWLETLHPDDIEITQAVWRKAVEEKQGYEAEFRIRRHDGVYRYFLSRGMPILNEDGTVREWVGACIDLTERRRQEEELHKLNRTLRALSRSSEALVRAEEESAFLEEVCRIVVQDCGYAMVWIGYASDDEEKTVRPVAHAGFDDGYLGTLNLTWADRERGRGPTGTAIRTGQPILCTDMLTDPRFEPWRDEAIRRGYASSIALPLLDGGRAFGAVTIYSLRPDPFSEDEIELLSEMADDLTYGIASLRLRLQSQQTLQALQESEARFRQLADSMPQLVWTATSDGRVDYYNRRLAEFTSHGQWTPMVYAEDRPRTAREWKRAVRTVSPYEVEHRMQLADGRFRWFLTRATAVPDEAGQVMKWYGTSTDVHDRKQAEEEREIARVAATNEKNRIEALIKTLPVGVAVVDAEGGIIRSNSMYEAVWGQPRPGVGSVDDYERYKAWWLDSGLPVQPHEWASARAVQKGESVTGQLMKIERFDGTTAFVMNGAAPIYDFDGRIAGSAVAILDITERIEAEQSLQKAKDELEDKVRERTAELILTLEDLEKSRDDLRKLASELVMAEERERKKISVLLHDEVAQALAATKMRLDLLRSAPGGDDFRKAVSEAQELLGQSIQQTRALMRDISNPVLYDMGLRVALEALAEDVTARQGISVSCSFGGRLRNLGQDLEMMIFQVVKELVQNTVKHSRARSAGIRVIEEKDFVSAVVTDDGQGFNAGNVGAVGSEGGFGLFSIRERVKSYGGKIHIESEPGRGSEVTVKLPKRAAGKTASLTTRNGKKKA